MDTRKIAGELRLGHWAGNMRERKDSGLSVRRWCREQGISEKTYYYWQRKLRESACERLAQGNDSALVPATPAFAQIQLPKESSGDGNITIRLSGAEVEITGHASAEVVESVLRILRESC